MTNIDAKIKSVGLIKLESNIIIKKNGIEEYISTNLKPYKSNFPPINPKVAPMIADNVKRRFSLKSQFGKITRLLRRKKKPAPQKTKAKS